MRTVLLSLAIFSCVALCCALVRPQAPLQAADPNTTVEKSPAPEFAGVSDWLNSKPLKMADLKGKVTVVHFWTFGCFNCANNYPHYRAWTDLYKDKDVVIVGIHTPEFDREKKVDSIAQTLKDKKLTFPVAVDNDNANWKAWNNRYWPAVYLVDKKGNIRHKWEGELGKEGDAVMRKHIGELLAEEK